MNTRFLPFLILTVMSVFLMVGCQDQQEVEDTALLNRPARQVMVLGADHVFELSGCAFTNQAPKYLDEALTFVENQPNQAKITIRALTDNVASDVDQLELTRSQAESIAAFLWAQGVSRDRLIVMGTRPSKTLPSYGLTPEQLAMSRRIEIISQDMGESA